MASTDIAMIARPQVDFQAEQVLTVAGGHFVHDGYTAFLSPLLPEITAKLGISLTSAGFLAILVQVPALLNPLLGYFADRASLRYFIILAPSTTAVLMSAIGLAPAYAVLALLLLAAGVSTAAFHAPAPAMAARLSGGRLGRGMSLFMAAGELGRTVGPLVAVAAVSWWGLEGMWRLMVVGLATSAILWWRLRDLQPQHSSHRDMDLARVWQPMRHLLPVLAAIILPRTFLQEGLRTFLPLLLTQQGASLWLAGAALATLQGAGIAGALAGGTLSDRLGRRRVLVIALVSGPILALLFLQASGWWLFPVLLALGVSIFAITPVLLAVVQEQFPANRALANGIYLAMAFLLSSAGTIGVGWVGDRLGLDTAFLISALLALLSLPAVWLLPS